MSYELSSHSVASFEPLKHLVQYMLPKEYVSVTLGPVLESCNNCHRRDVWGVQCNCCLRLLCVPCVLVRARRLFRQKKYFQFERHVDRCLKIINSPHLDDFLKTLPLFQAMRHDSLPTLRLLFVLCFCMSWPVAETADEADCESVYWVDHVRCWCNHVLFPEDEDELPLLFALVSGSCYVNCDDFMDWFKDQHPQLTVLPLEATLPMYLGRRHLLQKNRTLRERLTDLQLRHKWQCRRKSFCYKCRRFTKRQSLYLKKIKKTK